MSSEFISAEELGLYVKQSVPRRIAGLPVSLLHCPFFSVTRDLPTALPPLPFNRKVPPLFQLSTSISLEIGLFATLKSTNQSQNARYATRCWMVGGYFFKREVRDDSKLTTSDIELEE
jgi:hypothetical protein